jgi:hypothetical protein
MKKNIRLHPDEITRLRSESHARTLFGKAGFDVIDYSFGPRDVFTYSIIVAVRR